MSEEDIENSSKPLKLQMKFRAGKGGVMPPGTEEVLTVEITDGVAALHLQHSGFTRAMAKQECIDGVQSVYVERLQKCISKYPGMKKKEIGELILKRIQGLGMQGGQQ